MSVLHSSFLKNEGHGYLEKGISGERDDKLRLLLREVKKNGQLNAKID